MSIVASSLARRSLIPLGVGALLLAGSVATDALRFGPSAELGEEVTVFVVEPDVETVDDSDGSPASGSSTDEIVVVVSSDSEPIVVDVAVSSSSPGLDIAVASDAGSAGAGDPGGSGSSPEGGAADSTSGRSAPGAAAQSPTTPSAQGTPRSAAGEPSPRSGGPGSDAPDRAIAPDSPVVPVPDVPSRPDIQAPLPPALPFPSVPDVDGMFPTPDSGIPNPPTIDLGDGARIDEDAGIIVVDPDGDLADLTAAAAAGAASGAAAGVDPTAVAATGTAIDDDGDVAAGAQIYVTAESDGDGAAAAGAVAAAADNNATIGEPEVEAEAELELADDVSGVIEIYADASVVVISEDVSGQDDGQSLVIEAAIVIVRENEIVIVRANAATGRFDGSAVTMGNVVTVERELTIDQDRRIGDGDTLPTSLTERILVALGSSGTSPGAASSTPVETATTATIPASSVPNEFSSTDETLDDFVSEIIGAIDAEPTTEIDLDDESVADIDNAGGPIPTDDAITDVAPIEYDPDAAETEAEAEAEAEADANETGGAAAAGAASSSASAADASGSAEADDGLGQVESDGSSTADDPSAADVEPTDAPEEEAPQETADAASASTEAEATDGESVATSQDGPDDIEFDEELDAAPEPDVTTNP